MTLLTGVKRKSVYINGTYDFTDSISLNTDVLYNERQTFQQIAGYPFQSARSAPRWGTAPSTRSARTSASAVACGKCRVPLTAS
jgi:hypothetical protein